MALEGLHKFCIVLKLHLFRGVSLTDRAYMNDLEKQLATSGSRIVVLDEDGNVSTAAGGVADSNSK